MANLTYAQLKGVWLNAAKGTRYDTNGWASLMAAIAEAESSGDPTITNPTDNNGRQTSWGLWQISNGDHSAPATNWADPTENAKLAIGKLNNPSPADAAVGPDGRLAGLKAWGTFDSGAYRAYLSDKTAADTAAITGPDAVTTAQLTAANSAQADCVWRIGTFDLHNIGLGPIHGPSFAGICVFSRSQARALLGVGLLITGSLIIGWGTSMTLLAAGVDAAKYLGVIPGAGKMAAAGRSAEAAVTSKASVAPAA